MTNYEFTFASKPNYCVIYEQDKDVICAKGTKLAQNVTTSDSIAFLEPGTKRILEFVQVTTITERTPE